MVGEKNTANYFICPFTLNRDLLLKGKNAIENTLEMIDDAHSNKDDVLKTYRELFLTLEKISLSARTKLHIFGYEEEVQGFNRHDNFDELKEKAVSDLPVKIEVSKGRFTVKTPMIIKRKESRSKQVSASNYILADYVRLAVKAWVEENPAKHLEFLQSIEGCDLGFIVKRNVLKFNHSIHCDNDNVEASKVQNFIVRALGLPTDDGRCMDFISTLAEVESEDDVSTEFILLTKNYL